MPKCSRKKTEAWKELRKAYKKGPKRMKIGSERRKKGVDPLLRPETSRIIKIDHHRHGSIYAVVLKSVFERMGFSIGCEKTMREDKLYGAGVVLRKAFDSLGYNDRVLGNVKKVNLSNFARRCLISSKPFQGPSQASLVIEPSLKEVERMEKTRQYVKALFERYPY